MLEITLLTFGAFCGIIRLIQYNLHLNKVEIKKSFTKIMDYFIEAQCTAEDVIINSEEDIE